MPVAGIEEFARRMGGLEKSYVLIGGAACSLLFDQAGESFRATSDLDVVMLVEGDAQGFGREVWRLVRDGGYIAWRRSDGRETYYRFELPRDLVGTGSYPSQLEIFSRHPDFRLSDEESEVAPLPLGEGVPSLSAIVLDEGYYDFIRTNAVIVDGISTLPPVAVIPLKMRAHIDLNRQHEDGRHYNQKDLRKHRGDVVSLARLLPGDARLPLVGQMRRDAEDFLEDFGSYARRNTRRRKRRSLEATSDLLRRVYL